MALKEYTHVSFAFWFVYVINISRYRAFAKRFKIQQFVNLKPVEVRTKAVDSGLIVASGGAVDRGALKHVALPAVAGDVAEEHRNLRHDGADVRPCVSAIERVP